MASSSSITPSSVKKYDVFLSCSDERSPYSFTTHLYDVLRENKISTFIDDSRLQRGDEISPDLCRAIEGSRISLVILSKDYASSRLRLDELVKILECKEKCNQIVIPVYYDTHQSEVRNQTGPFADAFENHEAHKSVQKWRDALKQASYLIGFDLRAFRSEAALTQAIVDNILKVLKRMHIEGTIKRYRVHKDEDAFHDDVVNFKERYYSGHKGEEALHVDIINFKKRYYNGHKDEEALYDAFVNFIKRKDEEAPPDDNEDIREQDSGDEDEEAIHDDNVDNREPDSSHEDEEAIHDPKSTAEWFQRNITRKMFVAICFILELPSAVFDKLSSVHKPQYLLVSMVMSILTMLICIIQLVHQVRKRRVGWKQKRKILWPDFIGLFFVILQIIFTAIDYGLHLRDINDPIQISIWPLIFSFFQMFFTFFKEFTNKEASTKSVCSTCSLRASAVPRANIV